MLLIAVKEWKQKLNTLKMYVLNQFKHNLKKKIIIVSLQLFLLQQSIIRLYMEGGNQ